MNERCVGHKWNRHVRADHETGQHVAKHDGHVKRLKYNGDHGSAAKHDHELDEDPRTGHGDSLLRCGGAAIGSSAGAGVVIGVSACSFGSPCQQATCTIITRASRPNRVAVRIVTAWRWLQVCGRGDSPEDIRPPFARTGRAASAVDRGMNDDDQPDGGPRDTGTGGASSAMSVATHGTQAATLRGASTRTGTLGDAYGEDRNAGRQP